MDRVPDKLWMEACDVVQETQNTQFQSLGQEDSLKEEMATQSNILAWEIPWTEEPGRLQSMGLERVRHDLATEHGCNGDLWVDF